MAGVKGIFINPCTASQCVIASGYLALILENASATSYIAPVSLLTSIKLAKKIFLSSAFSIAAISSTPPLVGILTISNPSFSRAFILFNTDGCSESLVKILTASLRSLACAEPKIARADASVPHEVKTISPSLALTPRAPSISSLALRRIFSALCPIE